MIEDIDGVQLQPEFVHFDASQLTLLAERIEDEVPGEPEGVVGGSEVVHDNDGVHLQPEFVHFKGER